MATRTIATKLTLEGEAEYKAAIKNINAELALHKSELEKIEAAHKNDANSLAALQEKQSALKNVLDALGTKYNEHSTMLETAKQAQQKYAAQVDQLRGKLDALKSSTGGTKEEAENLAKELEKAEANLQKATNSVTYYQKQVNYTARDQENIKNELAATEKYLGEAEKSWNHCATSIDEFGNETKGAIDTLASALAAAGVAKTIQEITAAIQECVSAAADFEEAISTVEALSGATESELKSLRDMAKELGATTKFTAAESAKAMTYMAMAGWDANEMLAGMDGVLQLAAAAGEDLAQVSDIVTDNLTAFGLAAKDTAHFSDVLAAAATNSNTSVSIMGETFKLSASIAGALGYSVEDVAVAIGLMANSGVKGSIAGTALKNTFNGLLEGVTLTGAAFGEYEYSAVKADGTMKSFGSTIDELRGYFDQMTEAERVNNAMAIAGQRGYNGLLAILNATGEEYDSLRNSIADCSGAAAEMAEIKMDNLNGQLTLMNSAFDAVKIAVGEELSPELQKLAEVGTDAFSWAAEFVDKNPEIVSLISAVASSVVVLSGAITGYTVAVKVVIPVIEAFNNALTHNPAGITALAISTLVAALGTFIVTLPKSTDEVKALTDSLEESKRAFEETTGSIQKEADDILSTVAALESLTAVEVKSTAQKQAMAELVDQLNEAVPNLSLAYDAQTDSLNMTAASIRELAKAQAEQQMRAAEIQRLSDLYVEQAQITTDLAAAEYQLQEAQAALSAMQAEGTYWAMGYEAASNEVDQAVLTAAKSVKELTAAQSENQDAVEALEGKYEDARVSIEDTGDAAGDAGQQIESLTAASEDLTGSTKSLADEVDMLSAALQEQQESGSLSLDTTLALIDAGYAAAISINEETGAVTLSKDAYIQIAQAKLDDQIASLETQRQSVQNALSMEDEALMALDLAKSYLSAAEAREAMEGQAKSFSVQIAALEKLKAGLGSYTYTVQRAARTTSSVSKRVQTQAEKDLEKFKELKNALDHEKAMDEADEKEYYSRLSQYRDRYLTDSSNLDEYRKISEEIYKYDVSLAEAQIELWESTSKSVLDVWTDQLQGVVDEYEARVAEVNSAISSMQKKLAEYGDLFTIRDNEMSLNSLKAQTDAIKEYGNTLNELRDKGINGSLLNEIMGMGVDDATAYGQRLLGMAPKELEEYIGLWEEKQKEAQRIAEEFYQDELAALETDYQGQLADALDGMKDTAYQSGLETVQGLIEGLSAKENELYAKMKSIGIEMANAMAAVNSAASVDGSHAAGLAYVPFDGYIARLHQGERVLTAKEAQAYINRATPTNFDVPEERNRLDVGAMVAQAVSAAGAMAQSSVGNNQPMEFRFAIDLDGQTLARKTYTYNKREANLRGGSLVEVSG